MEALATPVQTGVVSAADAALGWVASGYGGGVPAVLYSSHDAGATWRALNLGS